MSEPTIDEQVANSKAKRSAIRKAWIYAAVLGVALACIAVLATLLWVRSNSDLTAVSESNDAGISQFEYCKKAPKTDPRCQEPVSKPADKIVQGPQGVQGIQGIEGPVGPQGPAGPRGPQGLPGNSPRCLLEPARCVGATGAAGPAGVQGKVGETGAQGEQGKQGEKGEVGSTGATGEAGPAGPAGPAGAQGEAGPAGPVGPAGPAGMVCPTGYAARQIKINENTMPPTEITVWACVTIN